MPGPLTLIAQDPLIAIVLTAFFLAGLVLHGTAQAHAAARAGDPTAVREGFGSFSFRHLTVTGLLWYLLLGLGLPRPAPLNLSGSRAVKVLLAGPIVLLVYALLLLVARQVLAAAVPAVDVVSQGIRLAAVSCVLHAVYFLVPLPDLDGGRILLGLRVPRVADLFTRLRPVSAVLPYLLWLVLWFLGVLAFVLTPLWNALQTLLSWLPL